MPEGLRFYIFNAEIEMCMGSRTYTVPLVDFLDMYALQHGLNGYNDYSIDQIKHVIKTSTLKFSTYKEKAA